MPRQKGKRQRGGQPGPRPLKTFEIPVVDPRGDPRKVVVRELRESLPYSTVERKRVVYELNSGERVQEIDQDTFLVVGTGETFVRVPK